MNMQITVPNLVLAQRVVNKMITAAEQFVADETGEAMVGIVDPGVNTGGVPTLYVLDTIAPDETAERQFYSFEQGDDLQGDIFQWLYDNWENQRTQPGTTLQPRFNSPLVHLGDWHRQPGYMIAPSGGDLHSAMDQLDDDHRKEDFLLVPIVTLGHPSTTIHTPGTNYLSVPQANGGSARIDFWYIKRGIAMFLPIQPVVYANTQLPALAPYPWHLLAEKRAELEIGQLDYDGLFVSDAIQWQVDGQTPLAIGFIVARQGASRLLLLLTRHDFPKSAPQAYVAPFQAMSADDDMVDMFEKLWATATPVPDPPGWQWTADNYLIDYVHAVEDALGIERPPEPDPDAITVIGDEGLVPTGASGGGAVNGDATDAAPAAASTPPNPAPEILPDAAGSSAMDSETSEVTP